MARVGFDCDGVLFDFTEQFRRYCQSYSLDELGEAATWEFFREWGWDEDAFLYWHQRFVEDLRYSFGGLIGGAETRIAIQKLRDAGHEIILVTARHTVDDQQGMIEEQTKDWLDWQAIKYDELHFESDKTKIDLDYFLDDRTENYEALLSTKTFSVLYEQPWNAEARKLKTCDSVGSVEEYVEAILNGADESFSISEDGELYGNWIEVGYVDETGGRSKMEVLQDSINKTIKNLSDAAVTGVFRQNMIGDDNFGYNESEIASNVSDGEVRVTSETGSSKGSKPVRFDLIPTDSLTELAAHYGKGASKYEPFEDGLENWRGGYQWSLTFAAAARHFFAMLNGEDIDEETGSKHAIAVAWHMMTLVHFMNREDLAHFDDRQISILRKRGLV